MRSRISIRGYVRPSVGLSVRLSIHPSVHHTRVETMQKCRFWPKLLSVRSRTHLMPCIRPCFFFLSSHLLNISAHYIKKVIYLFLHKPLLRHYFHNGFSNDRDFLLSWRDISHQLGTNELMSDSGYQGADCEPAEPKPKGRSQGKKCRRAPEPNTWAGLPRPSFGHFLCSSFSS